MNKVECIISLTSHTKSRIEKLPRYLYDSLLKYNDFRFKVVLTLFKDDVQFITKDLQLFIDTGLIELIIAEENLRSHLKYFYAMMKYRNLPILTIDDDTIYPYKMFGYMLEEHYKNPNLVLCRSAQELTFTDNKINSMDKWSYKPTECISRKNYAEGYGGVLYPADCLKISEQNIVEIKKCLRSDDIYLCILEIRNDVNVYYLPNMRHEFILSTKGEDAISLSPDIMNVANGYINLFEKDFNTIME